ncbi:MAG: hypothetical protein MZU79_05995 [Anaerotruncus sp.]|nr:hypothetical protein [Anaerotruncus sp.]
MAASILDTWIEQAKQKLHIAYGTASHGSQVVFGMGGIDAFLDQVRTCVHHRGLRRRARLPRLHREFRRPEHRHQH